MLTNGTYSMGQEFANGLFGEIVSHTKLAKNIGTSQIKDGFIELEHTSSFTIQHIPVSTSLSKTKTIVNKYTGEAASILGNDIETALISKIVQECTNVNATTTSIKSSNIISRIFLGIKQHYAALRFRPGDGIFIINPDDLGYLADTDQCKNLNNIGTGMFQEGKIAKLFGFRLEVVPSETLGSSINFLLFRSPDAIKEVKIRIDDAQIIVNDDECCLKVDVSYGFNIPEQLDPSFGYFAYVDKAGA